MPTLCEITSDPFGRGPSVNISAEGRTGRPPRVNVHYDTRVKKWCPVCPDPFGREVTAAGLGDVGSTDQVSAFKDKLNVVARTIESYIGVPGPRQDLCGGTIDDATKMLWSSVFSDWSQFFDKAVHVWNVSGQADEARKWSGVLENWRQKLVGICPASAANSPNLSQPVDQLAEAPPILPSSWSSALWVGGVIVAIFVVGYTVNALKR